MGMVNICRKFQEILERNEKKIAISHTVNEESISKEKYEKAVAFLINILVMKMPFVQKKIALIIGLV